MNQTNSERPSSANHDECVACGMTSAQMSLTDQTFLYGEPGKEVSITASVPVWTCSACGTQYTDEQAEVRRHEAVCKHLGVLSPREILALRISYKLTQAELSALTGFGEASIKRWENGNVIQNISTDRFLRLLGDPSVYEKLRRLVEGQEQGGVSVTYGRFHFQSSFGADEIALARNFKLRQPVGTMPQTESVMN